MKDTRSTASRGRRRIANSSPPRLLCATLSLIAILAPRLAMAQGNRPAPVRLAQDQGAPVVGAGEWDTGPDAGMAGNGPTTNSFDFFSDAGMSADCGMGCPPTWRVRVEGVLLNREGEAGASLSRNFRLTDFDHEMGGRITLDRKFDCTIGLELVYSGMFEWEEADRRTGNASLNSLITPSGINISAFDGADVHEQLHRSRLQSIEALQKWWGWDVITTSFGLRYLNVAEDFSFRSVDNNGDIGFFSVETDNHLVGAQLGLEMLYPIGNWSFDSSIKGGFFVNYGDSNTFLSNAGAIQIDTSADDIEFAAAVEGGYYIRRAITPRLNVRAGYEFLWVYGLGIAARQPANPFSGVTGTSFNGKDDTFYHGGTLGVELVW